MRACVKCGLPETYNNIKFDSIGVCNYCNFYDEHRNELLDFNSLENKFLNIIEEVKQKARDNNSRYDCMVGISGGKDSTYIIYQLKHKYNLNILAFTYDNGFSTDYMNRNIENVLKKLDVDYVKFTPRDSFLRKNYSMTLNAMKNFCITCGHYLHYNSFLTAFEKKIPIIINGRSRGQVLQFATSTKMLEPFERIYGLRGFEHVMRNMVDENILKQVENAGLIDYLDDIKVESLSYFMYHPYNEDNIKSYIAEKIGWQDVGKTQKHPDCWAHAVAEKFNIDVKGFPIITGDIAVDIRDGSISLEQAKKIIDEEQARYTEIDSSLLAKFKERVCI